MRSKLWPDPTWTWDASHLSDWRGAGTPLPIPDGSWSRMPYATGTFPMGAQMKLSGNNLELAGAGMTLTTLTWDKTLFDLFGIGTYGGTYGYSWGGGLLQAEGVNAIYLHDLTIQFPPSPYLGHFNEKGYNALAFYGCRNVYLRNLRIVNADSGIFIRNSCQSVTVDNIIFSHPGRSPNSGWYGHHGIDLAITITNVLCKGIHWNTKFVHDYSVESEVSLCVLGDADGWDVNFDHHRGNPNHNLFTNVNVGAGSRIWTSGGNPIAGPNEGLGEVFWNICLGTGAPINYVPSDLTNWPDLTVIGYPTTVISPGRYLEGIWPVDPVNLYDAQCGHPASPPPPPPPPPPKFAIGQRIKTLSQVNVRLGPALSQTLLGTQPTGSIGTVLQGPVKDTVSGYTYWQINYDVSVDGWTGEDKLTGL